MDEPTPTIDPLEFVVRALEHVPDDPTHASGEDLQTLAAIAYGVARYAGDIRDEMRRLAHRVVDGHAMTATADEVTWLQALRRRCELASEHLDPYVLAAAAAHGCNPAEMAAGIHDPKEQ